MLQHHINPTTEMNDVAFNVMYERLGFPDPAAMELVHTKGINRLGLLGGLDIERVKSLVKATHHTGGAAIGNAVSKNSITPLFQCKIPDE